MRAVNADGFVKHKNREWNDRGLFNQWRASWASHCSSALASAGFEAEAKAFQNSHLTLKKQRQIAIEQGDLFAAKKLDRAPTTKMGTIATAIKRRGGQPRRDGQPHYVKPHPLDPAQIAARARTASDVSRLWAANANAVSFKAGLESSGYKLMKGRKNRFLVVDQQGNHYSVTRMLRLAGDETFSHSSIKAIDVQEKLQPIARQLKKFKKAAQETMGRNIVPNNDNAPRTKVYARKLLVQEPVVQAPVKTLAVSDASLLQPAAKVNLQAVKNETTKIVPIAKQARSQRQPFAKTYGRGPVSTAAQLAYDAAYKLGQARIDAVLADRGLTPYQRNEAVAALRLRQQQEARMERVRVILDERAQRKAERTKTPRRVAPKKLRK
jgi:hypothetical protein